MIYSIEKAILITEQLRKFKDAYNYQLAGHFENVDFWINEVKSSIQAIDNYNKRFNKLCEGQNNWIENHDEPVHEYCPICEGKCEFSDGIPSKPRRADKELMKETRKNLINTTYYFLVRGYNSKIINKKILEKLCDEIETSIDTNDLKY